jgi:hypothetical protein
VSNAVARSDQLLNTENGYRIQVSQADVPMYWRLSCIL